MRGGKIMTGIWTIIAAALSFAISGLLGIWLVPFLRKLHFGQTILDIGPKWHKGKQGTPTMGGFMFIAASIVVTTLCVLLYYVFSSKNGVPPETALQTAKIFAGLFMAAAFGAIGFIDDYVKVAKKRNLGLTPKQKLALQFLVAAAYLATMYFFGEDTSTYIPFIGSVDIGILYYPIAAILIVGFVNAVNLTDGIDGLDGSITFFASIFLILISGYIARIGLSVMSAALAGGCLGFLVWNFHPAKTFMGDTGSLFLGGYLCALLFGLDMEILMVLIGFVYIAEMFSVILQVSYFKLTHGKRLFKMSPIHHHFEMCGWSEVKIVTVFSIVEAVCGAASLALVMTGGRVMF